MTGSRLASTLAMLALLGSAAACSSDDDAGATTSKAGPHLVTLMDGLRDELTDGGVPLKAWQVSDDGAHNRAAGCRDGTARRTYAATLVVPDTTGQDAEGREAKLLGKLGQAGWHPQTVAPKSGTDPTEVKGRRHDGSGARLSIGFTPVEKGWRYVVNARTACLETE